MSEPQKQSHQEEFDESESLMSNSQDKPSQSSNIPPPISKVGQLSPSKNKQQEGISNLPSDEIKDEQERVEEKPLVKQEDSAQLYSNNVEPSVQIELDEVEEDSLDVVIDPIKELLENNNVIPILAVIDQIDLTIIVEDHKPLLHVLCTKFLPLNAVLSSIKPEHKIEFNIYDQDNRSALHYAVEADDVRAAYWLMQNKIENKRDNFGHTPILDAIRLGRKRIFLLCLQFQSYYDSEAPHFCAIHNRSWELKILHNLKYDVLQCKDHEHLSPIQRAVQNYSFQSANYLARITHNVNFEALAEKTDSEGIIRQMKNTKKQTSFIRNKFIELAKILLHVICIYLAIQNFHYYSNQKVELCLILLVVELIYVPFITIPLFNQNKSKTKQKHQRKSLLPLLQAPDFPVLEDICPECIKFEEPGKDHCFKCSKCVQKFHFHTLVCINKSNEIYWFISQFMWLYLTYILYKLLSLQLTISNFMVYKFSENPFFFFSSMVEDLYHQGFFHLAWFFYLCVFFVYQICICFELVVMMVLNRTFREVNQSENYRHLYKIVKTEDGCFKNKEIRLMEHGLKEGLRKAVKNFVFYFFK